MSSRGNLLVWRGEQELAGVGRERPCPGWTPWFSPPFPPSLWALLGCPSASPFLATLASPQGLGEDTNTF